jgi:hypothetical protein
MPSDTVTLALEGRRIALDHYASAITQFAKLVDALSDAAGAPGLRWEVESLEVSSAITTARAADLNGHRPEHVQRVTEDYLRLGGALKGGNVREFPQDVRRPATALAGLLHQGVESVRFETAEDDVIVTESRPTVERVVREAKADRGAVTGRVQTISSRSKLRFVLYDLLADRAVSCYVEPGNEDKLVGIWDKVAIVEGLVKRDPETGRPLAVRHITNIHVIEDEGQRGGYLRARGVLRRRPGEPRAEERIRRLRDGA